MNLEKLKNISIIAMCFSIAGVVTVAGGFALVMMIINSGRGGLD